MAANSHPQTDLSAQPIAHNSPLSQPDSSSSSPSLQVRPSSSRTKQTLAMSTTKLKTNHMLEHDHRHLGVSNKSQESKTYEETNAKKIFLSSSTMAAHKMISPFLTEHIPDQYNPQPKLHTEDSTQPSNIKYCYRHRPDVKCRRMANEPTMEELQDDLGQLSQSDQQGISTVWSLFSAAPSRHRHLMLQGILAQCCYPQLSMISNSIRDLIKIDFLDALPPELAFKILLYLDTGSLCKASQVSRKWRHLADDDVVWHKMCEQHIDRKCTKCGWGLPLLEQQRLRTEKRQMQLRASNRGINAWSPNITPLAFSEHNTGKGSELESVTPGLPNHRNAEKRSRPGDDSNHDHEASTKRVCVQSTESQDSADYFDTPKTRPWKDVYKDRFKVGTNWKYGRCTLQTFKGHTSAVMCLAFEDNILATGSYDNTAKIWDIDTGKELRTLTGHTAGIRCLQLAGGRLFTGSADGSLKVWNWRTGELKQTYSAHLAGVISLHYRDKFLTSSSMDKTIKVWDLANKQSFTLRGHTDWVNSVKLDLDSRTLFSASDDCTARLWDLDTRQCIKIFKGHVGQVQQVLPLPLEFEPEEEEHTDYDVSDQERSGSEAPEYLGAHAEDLNPDLVKPELPNYMLTGSLDSTIRLWHIPSGRCVRTFFGHLEGIWSIAADSLRMVSGAEDRMVKVWDPRTGQHERTFTGHSGPVTCVGLSDSRLATGSEDSSVRIYSFEAEGSSLVVEGEPADSRLAHRRTPA